MTFSNKVYDVLKFIALILLPLVAAAYYVTDQFYALPDVTEVLGSLSAADTALGGLLHISTSTYSTKMSKYAGVIEILEDAISKKFSLNLSGDPHEIKDGDVLTFKVKSTDADAVATPATTTATTADTSTSGTNGY